jgi:hypothetical protein
MRLAHARAKASPNSAVSRKGGRVLPVNGWGAEKVPCRSSAPIRCLDRSRSGSAPDGCRSSADHRCTAAWRRCAQSHVYRVRDGGSKDGYGRIDATKPLESLMWRRTVAVEPDRDRFFSLRRSTLRPVPLDPPSPSIAPRTDTLRRERPADQPRLQLAGIERRLYRSGCPSLPRVCAPERSFIGLYGLLRRFQTLNI